MAGLALKAALALLLAFFIATSVATPQPAAIGFGVLVCGLLVFGLMSRAPAVFWLAGDQTADQKDQ